MTGHMRATYTTAVRYQAEAICQTPLRTAGAGGELDLVLRDWRGRPLIQGSSLAGALRSWLTDSGRGALAERLFGGPDQAGHLLVSDGLFDERAEVAGRPRLRLDPASGTAARRGKFEVAHVCTGARFAFFLTWLGEEPSGEIPAVERMLAALDCGEIRLGAQKSSGFGRVSLQVKKRVYDLRREEDRTAWLEDREDGERLSLPVLERVEQVTFTLEGRTDSLLVKESAPEHTARGSCVKNLREGDIPVLPGASIKGAVRARATAIARRKGIPAGLLEDLFGKAAGEASAGRARFEDAALSPDRSRRISRIRINRFTAGAIRGGLFFEEPVCSDLRIRITAPAECRTGCALLICALRDLGLGLYTIGSGGAVGRGRIQVREIAVEAPGGRRATLAFDEDGACAVSDKTGLLREWFQDWEVPT